MNWSREYQTYNKEDSMKLILNLYNDTYTVEDDNNDMDSGELKELFSRLLVCAGFPPSVIDIADGGRYEYVSEDEKVIKKKYAK